MTCKVSVILLLSMLVFGQKAAGQGPSPTWGKALIKGKSQMVYRSFSPTLQKALPFRPFQKSLRSIQKQFGTFNTLELRKDSGGVAVYELYTEKAYFELHVSYDEKGLQGFFIQNAGYRKPVYATNQSYYQQHYMIPVNDTLQLPGRLLAPRVEKRIPLVILVHGSGPLDMDESIGPNKVFWDIAQGLAAHGIASFRYDKRTRVSAAWQKIDSLNLDNETVLDALSSLEEVWNSELIDTGSVWVLGHSLGGYAVPRILQLDERWKGGIIMGGNSRPVHELVTEQVNYLTKLDSRLSMKERVLRMKVFRIEKSISEKNWKLLEKRLKKSNGMYYWPVAFFRQNSEYDPAKILLEEIRTVLVLQGGRDYQVDTSNYTLWKQTAALNPSIKTSYFPALNHLFIEGTGAPNPAEYFRPGNVSFEVITEMARIIQE